jgi:hypothetical protein
MTAPLCDIGQGDIVISQDYLVQCNGAPQNISLTSQSLILNGTTQQFGVSISGSSVSLRLSNVAITTATPFVSDASSINISIDGFNKINSTSDSQAGISCRNGSTFVFSALSNGNLVAIGGMLASGIGTDQNGTCDSLLFLNGSYSISGGTGIGAGSSESGVSSVGGVKIAGGSFDITASGNGAGIGSGYGHFGTSSVSTVAIIEGTINVTSGSGAGIGAGSTQSGNSTVNDLTISGGMISVSVGDAMFGAAIGSGYTQGGISVVNELTIVGGEIDAENQGSGAGIGSGSSNGVSQE